jgi:hypothetical protein
MMTIKSALQAEPGRKGRKAVGEEGSGKPLSARSVAKILILAGSVWRYGRRLALVDGNPFANDKKPRAASREPRSACHTF